MRDFAEIEKIMDAFRVLSYPDEVRHEEGFWDKLEPLVAALRDQDHDALSAAILRRKRLYGKAEKCAELKWGAAMIATQPEKFGVEKLTKADVLEILAEIAPDLLEFLPTSKGGMRDWYKSLGVNLDQSRGRPNSAIKRWLENHRKNPPGWKWKL